MRILACRTRDADPGDARLDEEIDDAIERGTVDAPVLVSRRGDRGKQPRDRRAIPVVRLRPSLERHAQGELHHARRDPGASARMRPKFGEFWRHGRIPQVDPVERVERFDAHLQSGASARRERLVQARDRRSSFRPAHRVAPRIAECARARSARRRTCRTSAEPSPQCCDRPDSSGSPEMSARCPPVPVRALSTPLVTVNPPPLCIARMPVSDQSLSTADAPDCRTCRESARGTTSPSGDAGRRWRSPSRTRDRTDWSAWCRSVCSSRRDPGSLTGVAAQHREALAHALVERELQRVVCTTGPSTRSS